MVITAITWICFFLITVAYGVGTVKFLHSLLRLPDDTILPFSVLGILGLNTITWLSSILSLFLKMGWLAHLLILIGALFFVQQNVKEIKASFRKEFCQKHWIYWGMLLLGGITTVLYAVKTPSNTDTLLYHAQAIHWIEDFPAVPGLANLDPRLGSNSNWFVVNALFSLSFLKLQSFHLVPSFLFLICLTYFLGGLQNILVGDARLSQIVKAGFIPLAFYVLIDEISSPGTDLPVILFYWVILCLWIEMIEGNQTSRLLEIVVFILSIFVITYKVSGLLLLLIGFWILIKLVRQREYRQLWICIGVAATLLLPWLIRNFVLSGYWLYPEPQIAFISPNVDWKVPVARVRSFKEGIQAWGISPGLKWPDLVVLSLRDRLDIWSANLTISQKMMLILSLISPILFWFFFFLPSSTNKSGTLSSYWLIIFTAFLNLLFWLLTAPNFRFGYGFVIGMIVLALAAFVKLMFENLKGYRSYLIIGLILVLSVQQVYVILEAGRDGTHYIDYLFMPAPYPHVPSDACKIGDQTILCARNWRQCGYDAFPCVPQAPKNVEMRSDIIRDGFHWIPSNNGN